MPPFFMPLVRLCVRKQLEELQMLRTRYADAPHGTTFRLADNGAEAQFNRFIDPACPANLFPDAQLHYTFSIELPAPGKQRLDVHVTMPLFYPAGQLPSVSVLSAAHTNEVLRSMRLDVERLVVDVGQLPLTVYLLYVNDVVQWLQANVGRYARRPAPQQKAQKTADAGETAGAGRKFVVAYPLAMQRLWVRVAHLSCNNMRQNALRLAKRLRLGGFQRPGWPGYLCVEGPRAQTQEWWRQIRTWHWQKIAVRRTDDATVANDEEAQHFRRFRGPYRDLDATNQLLAGAGGKPCEATSTGMFVKFLERNQSADAMVALFGARGGQYAK